MVGMFGAGARLPPSDFLEDKVDTLGHVKLTRVQTNPVEPVFASLDDQAPLGDTADYLQVTGSVAGRVNITAYDFWRRATGQAPGPAHLYYEMPVHADFKHAAKHLPEGVPTGKRGPLTARLLFAPAGTWVRPFHYLANTFLTVLDGEVTVSLFAPNQTVNLYPYPRNHPNGRSTQVLHHEGLVSPWQVLDIATKFRNIPKAEGLKTTLKAGDTLYVPPFWYYQLHFLAPSVALKTFSSFYEGEVLDDLLRLDIPHIDHLDTEVAAVKRAIDLIAREALLQDPSAFVRRLVESRYTPLYQHLTLVTSTDFVPCQQGLDEQTEKHTQDFLLPYVAQVTNTLKALDTFGFVKELVTQEFVEHLVHKALGAEDAYNFYAHCFATGVTNSRSTAQDIE